MIEDPLLAEDCDADDWTLRYQGFDPEREGQREALCAVGNGYFVTRAAAPESVADGVHYPGTYLAGCYHRAVSEVHGRQVVNEDLVNGPNWLAFSFRAADAKPGAPWFGEPGFTVLPDSQTLELDLRTGELTRRAICRDPQGRHTRITQRRLAHMGRPHIGLLETEIAPEDWVGELTIRSGVDGRVDNLGVARYRELNSHHLDPQGQGGGEQGDPVWLHSGPSDSPLRIAVAARTVLRRPHAGEARWELRVEEGRVAEEFTVPVRPGETVVAEKIAALCTSRDRAMEDPPAMARRLAAEAPAAAELRGEQALRWRELWNRCRLEVRPDHIVAVRLHLFHLMQTFSEHSVGLDVGIPARGLHGEAYRGHVFWDELFILPLLNLRFPELSRAVLEYRHRRLPAARRAALSTGATGAMYPWQSGMDGHEETQEVHLNPKSGRWHQDRSRLQRHVGLAVGYNVWQYYQATGDDDFLARAGAEMLLEIARYWAHLAEYDRSTGRYRIRGVMGPDEYHDGYPWTDAPGLDDNAYSNVLASWTLSRALEALGHLPGRRRGELLERIGLDADALEHWNEISRRLTVPFHDGVISQFAGYERLEELDWEGYRAKYGDIRRLDRILEAEGDTPNRYRVSKQADVLMLWYLFPPSEVLALLDRMGYRPEGDPMREAAAYYLRRTAHGSTLSAVVHAWVLARCDRRASWEFFREATAGDLEDVQGGTTAEGIHLGAMVGTVDLLQRCYPGLDTRADALFLEPNLPSSVATVELNLRYRGHWDVGLRLTHEEVVLRLPDEPPGVPVRVVLPDGVRLLRPGETQRVLLPPNPYREPY
ncbi:glycoside hydrolase family 65 protein [Phaeacidiphilus oryzae]|uniref:glycoside hydrolase family 65 protein n=1 Tax=Phaeacidiphilus oryzae TaxID=348818 RepID=UPI00068BDBA2|nr:glycosyl hydrolase family 65 protein [Phaeacidiphilus oryzae]